MKIIRPLQMTDAMLVASNVAENDYPEYNPATTYAQGDRVISTSTHRVYVSLQNNNVGNDLSDPDWWYDERATNRWRAFDQRVADRCENAGSVQFSIVPGGVVTAAAFFNLDATQLDVTVNDSGEGVVYSASISLVDNSAVDGWWSWFFEPIQRRREVVLLDLPPYPDAQIDIAISAPGGTAGVGEIVIGHQRQIGEAQLGVRSGIQSFSYRERDEFGNLYIVKRPSIDVVEFPVTVRNSDIDYLRRLMAQYIDTPLVFVGKSDGGWGTLVYGFFEEFDVVIPNKILSEYTLKVQGLV